MTINRLTICVAVLVCLSAGCQSEAQVSDDRSASKSKTTSAPATTSKTASPESPDASEAHVPEGPFGETRYVVEDVATRYTRDIEGDGQLVAVLATSAGTIRCLLHEDLTPRTVDNFVGLARGLKPWREPDTGKTVKRPFFDGLSFHRVIPGLLIQSGDPTGRGMGHPGYTFADEFSEGLHHSGAGVLAMAQSHPDGNGSQFFITDGAAPQFDGRYPIFGQCENTDVIKKIATSDVGDSLTHAPKEPVLIQTVTFERREK